MSSSVNVSLLPPSWLIIQTGRSVIHVDSSYLKTLCQDYMKGLPEHQKPEDPELLPRKDMPKADYIFLTYHHADHCKPETIRGISHEKTVVFGPESCAAKWPDIRIVKPGDEIREKDFSAKVVEAYNTPDSRATRKVHKKGGGAGYIFRFPECTVYHAGDTDVIPEMADFGEIDAAFLPIGGAFTMDMEEAAEAVRILSPKTVCPMHYKSAGCPETFRRLVGLRSDAVVLVLNPGEPVTF